MILTSVIALVALGITAAIILSVASRFLSVEEDPRIAEICEVLPGANCGGCGFAGCSAYAEAVVTNPDVPANLCVAGSDEISEEVGKLAGKAIEVAEPMVTFRRCNRVEGNVKKKFEYIGAKTCASAALVEDGPYMCSWACLGLGDCLRACPFDAMQIHNGMVEIISEKCTSCGMCIETCPRSILQLIPRRARVMMYCATRERLRDVSDVCEVGCINCLKCLKSCPADAITYEKRRIEINHELCLEYGADCGEACVESCPRKILRHRVRLAKTSNLSDLDMKNEDHEEHVVTEVRVDDPHKPD